MSTTLAFIGAGGIGKWHIESAHARGIPISWIVDLRRELAEGLAATCQARASDRLQDIWDDADTQAVVIGVPNSLHCTLAMDAMKHGKDVFLEKPMAMSVAECQEINRRANASGRVLQIGFVHRYSQVARLGKKLVSEGALGRVHHVKAHLYRRRGVPGLGRWFTQQATSGGGAVVDVGVHLLDLSLHLLGHPTPLSVTGQVHHAFGKRMRDYVYDSMWAGPPDYQGFCDVEDSGHALIRFADGLSLDLHVTWAENFPTDALPSSLMGFFGDRAGITFQLEGDHVMLAGEQNGRLTDVRFSLPESSPLQDQIDDFVQAVETRTVRGATGPQATMVQALVEAIYDSSARQDTTPIDPIAEGS